MTSSTPSLRFDRRGKQALETWITVWLGMLSGQGRFSLVSTSWPPTPSKQLD